MKHVFSLAVLAASVVCSSAKAAGVALLVPVTYDPAASVPPKVREECRLDYQLQSDIANALVRRYKTGSGTTESATEGQAVRVTITYVLGPAAGALSGPKSTTILAELLNNGKVERSTKLHRTSVSVNIFRGTCSILDKTARVLAKDVVRWIENPGYVPSDEPDSEGAASAPAAASAAAN